MQSLNGKVVLVTGAARRIGRGIALRLHREGARVAIHYSSSEDEARQTAAECGHAPLFRADLVHVDEIERLFSEVEGHFGRIDAVVNNAARFTRVDPLQMTEADWDYIHDVNLKATFFCCQQAARRMMAGDGGRIVNLSSLGGLRPWAHHAHYCASKAGVVMLTRALAVEFGQQGIRVNCIAPGGTKTRMTAAIPENIMAGLLERIPLKRMAEPSEILRSVGACWSVASRSGAGLDRKSVV